MFLYYLVKLENCNCCWFHWHIACETSKLILQEGCFPSSDLSLWLWNMENNAALLRRGSVMSANWSRRWLTCNMGCSRQSLMKLTPVNGMNICELVFVPEMDVFSTCFISRTICQVGGLQRVLAANTTVTFWQWWSRLLHKLHVVCHKSCPARSCVICILLSLSKSLAAVLDFSFWIAQDSVATHLRWGGWPCNSYIEFFGGICQWKSFENRSTFAEVMIKSQVYCFLTLSVLLVFWITSCFFL